MSERSVNDDRAVLAAMKSGAMRGWYTPVSTEDRRWPGGPCGQVVTGCTLCSRALGNGGGLVLCTECGEALRDPWSPLGILLRESYEEAKRAACRRVEGLP